MQHGFDLLRGFFSEKANLNAFVGALDACIPGAAMQAIDSFNSWCVEGTPHSIQFNTYVASLSEHPEKENNNGRLSMWRAFGGTMARVAIVLAVPHIARAANERHFLFSPVIYMNAAQAKDVYFEVIDNIKNDKEFMRSLGEETIKNCVFTMLLMSMTCLKHEGFQEEREWRVIYTPRLFLSPLMEMSTEIIGGTPQPVYKLPLDAQKSDTLAELDFAHLFDRLIIGPTPYPWAMYEAFVADLHKAGITNAEERVFISGIPIRPYTQ